MIRLTAAAVLVCGGVLQAANATALLLEAQAQFQESHYEQALKLYKEAQDQAGGEASIEYNIGLCHLRLGDGDKAVQHFERVASRADARPALRRDALFNVGLVRAGGARQRLEAMLNPQAAGLAGNGAEPEEEPQPPRPPDDPANIEDLQGIAGELLRAIALFRECEHIEASIDAAHNMRAVRITRRQVLGLLRRAVEAKEKEDMLNDPPAYLKALIGQQRTAVGLTRHVMLDASQAAGAQRQARRAILRLQGQIMDRTGTFAGHLAQFVESADQDQQSPAEQTPREQVYHAAAAELEHSIEAQRDASAFLMDGQAAEAFDHKISALDEMYVALRLFPQQPQQALVSARGEQAQLQELVSGIQSDSGWLQDAILGRAHLADGAQLAAPKTALYYDQSQVLSALSSLRAQCEQIAAASPAADQAGGDDAQTPAQLDPELNRQLAETMAAVDALRISCLDAIAAREKAEALAAQQRVLDMIDAALALLPKTIEQRIAELVVRQAGLNEQVKAESGEDAPTPGQQQDPAVDALQTLAAEARAAVLGGPPAEVAERIRTEQDNIQHETESVHEELKQQIPTGSAGAAPSADAQSPQVQAYIESAKHLEQADFEMLVALEGLDRAMVLNALTPMQADGPVQVAQAKALQELIQALQALRPPEDQEQCDQQDQQQQDQQEQQDPQEQQNQDARRAVERADEQREEAERELHQRRPRTVIKDW